MITECLRDTTNINRVWFRNIHVSCLFCDRQTLLLRRQHPLGATECRPRCRESSVQEENMESQVCTVIKDAESKSVHIPQEITENILTRHPVKSLVRFESVCKSWRSWLTNPGFRRRDSQEMLYISTSDGFFQTMTEQGTLTKKFPVPWDDSKSKVRVSNSCNGMVLVCVGDCFYLFNPSTHYFAKVLTLDYMSDDENEESNYYILIGLYYDETIGDYKAVVLIQYGFFLASYSASILVEASLKGKRWNHIDHDNPNNSYRMCRDGPLVNGQLHWLNNGVIIRFNPVLKVFENLSYLQPPQNRTNGRKIVGIGFLEGCLCVSTRTVSSRTVNGNCVEILAMKEYGVSESWNPIFSVMDIYDCCPLLLTRAGKMLISSNHEYINTSKICVYDLAKKSFAEFLRPEKEISTCAVSFEQNMDTPSGYYWNHTEHENFGKTNFERMQEFSERINWINSLRWW